MNHPHCRLLTYIGNGGVPASYVTEVYLIIWDTTGQHVSWPVGSGHDELTRARQRGHCGTPELLPSHSVAPETWAMNAAYRTAVN